MTFFFIVIQHSLYTLIFILFLIYNNFRVSQSLIDIRYQDWIWLNVSSVSTTIELILLQLT